MRFVELLSNCVVAGVPSLRRIAGQAALVAAAILTPTCAQAAMVFSALEAGGNVVFTGAGSFDTAGLFATTPLPLPASVRASHYFLVGPAAATPYQFYEIASTGPASIGPGLTPMNATSGSGNLFGLNFLNAPQTQLFVAVPTAYVSGSALSGTATYSGQTLASLGLTEGVYTWPAGGNTVTLTVAAVPEPSALAPLLILGAVGFVRRRRQA